MELTVQIPRLNYSLTIIHEEKEENILRYSLYGGFKEGTLIEDKIDLSDPAIEMKPKYLGLEIVGMCLTHIFIDPHYPEDSGYIGDIVHHYYTYIDGLLGCLCYQFNPGAINPNGENYFMAWSYIKQSLPHPLVLAWHSFEQTGALSGLQENIASALDKVIFEQLLADNTMNDFQLYVQNCLHIIAHYQEYIPPS